ncbi:MAG: alpha-glucoside transport system substrate-binding protein [Frankiaceae bacterium]|nr:alpha-glucoside transport system substrate-binding protein [Frankiaceae bacterium]
MIVNTRRRPVMALAAVSCVALALAGCSSKSTTASPAASGSSPASSTGTGSASGSASGSADCSAFQQYTGHSGTTVTMYSTITDVEQDRLNQSFADFTKCTGITVKYEGSQEFETQIQVRVKGGKAPDIALFPQPGLMAQFKDQLKPVPAAALALAKTNYRPDTLKYGELGGTLYATPYDSNVKSFVWYSPKFFTDNSYTVPTTWDEMTALSDKIVADHPDMKPWCAGIASDAATGWPLTDWLEDVMLRTQAPTVYDDWLSHKIPFNDPKLVTALDKVGSIVKNDKYVNGAFGGVDSIATTTFKEAGLGISTKGGATPTCALMRQASFYAANFPAGTNVAPDGDAFAFYLPTIDASLGKPVLGAGTFIAAFNDKPEVVALRTYMATKEYSTGRVKLGTGWVSGNKNVPIDAYSSAIDKLSAQLLQDPKVTFRFDASDLMPAAVGSGSEWKQLTNWITGQSTKQTLDTIEASWPKSS